MTTDRQAQAALIFLFSAKHPQARWQAFARYFHEHHYACYACPVGASDLSELAPALPSATERSAEPPGIARVLVACGADCDSALSSSPMPGPPLALAWLFPSLAPAWRLAFRPPAVPTWLAYPAQNHALRLAARFTRDAVTPHSFGGIHTSLLDQPGWERVAFALRTWIEQSLSPMRDR